MEWRDGYIGKERHLVIKVPSSFLDQEVIFLILCFLLVIKNQMVCEKILSPLFHLSQTRTFQSPISHTYPYTAFSLSHGAGRHLSRSKATQTLTRKYPDASGLCVTRLGSRVVCGDRQVLWEEHPDAYKDVGVVVGDLVELGVVRVLAVLRPVVSVKV